MAAAEFWIDMNLPATMTQWLSDVARLPCRHFNEMGLHTAADADAFRAARAASAVVFTKDADFAQIVRFRGAPPQVVWIRFGNTTNTRLQKLLEPLIPSILSALTAGEPLIEITSRD